MWLCSWFDLACNYHVHIWQHCLKIKSLCIRERHVRYLLVLAARARIVQAHVNASTADKSELVGITVIYQVVWVCEIEQFVPKVNELLDTNTPELRLHVPREIILPNMIQTRKFAARTLLAPHLRWRCEDRHTRKSLTSCLSHIATGIFQRQPCQQLRVWSDGIAAQGFKGPGCREAHLGMKVMQPRGQRADKGQSVAAQ
mmetsp:Transcript_135237/g.337375  ORF Transcript_135237/g.337375 Transcript_135237/m.337375 type:complete len:200 (+) Transcript_135237:1620-2219(+)